MQPTNNVAEKTPAPLTQREALGMLDSALSYCRQSGIEIHVGQADGCVWVMVQAMYIDAANPRFVPLITEGDNGHATTKPN